MSIDAERAAVHAEIATLEKKLEQLAEARKDVSRQLKTVVHPILTLPNEVTAEIFAYYAQLMKEHYESLESAPFVLGQVCRTWRQIALSLPKIWANVFMGSVSSPGIDSLLQLWFQRAGPAPLHVDACEAGSESRLYSLLTTYSDRFESFGCALPLPVRCSLDALEGRIGKLRNLTLGINAPADPIFLSDAPALRKLTLFYTCHAPWQPFAPCAQLTELEVLGNITNLILALAEMPQLEVLALPAAEYLPAPSFQLSKLRTLSCTWEPTPTLRFLSCITAPALEELQIMPVEVDMTIIHSFFDRAPHLHSLTLLRPCRPDSVFFHVPQLRKLTLKDVVDPSYTLQIIALIENILPNLRELIVVQTPINPCGERLLDLVRLRGGPPSAAAPSVLRRLEYRVPRNNRFAPAAIKVVRDLKHLANEVGCQVDISLPDLVHARHPETEGTPLYSLDDVDDDDV